MEVQTVQDTMSDSTYRSRVSRRYSTAAMSVLSYPYPPKKERNSKKKQSVCVREKMRENIKTAGKAKYKFG
jgi:hypothetical protein